MADPIRPQPFAKVAMKLFIAGYPRVGKTKFGDWLRDNRGFNHLDMERLPQQQQDEFINLRYDLREFLEHRAFHSQSFVATWGFPIGYLQKVEELQNSSFHLIWFYGDKQAGEREWVRTEGEKTLTNYRKQVSELEAYQFRIKDIFGSYRVQTLLPNCSRPSFEEIFDQISDMLPLKQELWVGGV